MSYLVYGKPVDGIKDYNNNKLHVSTFSTKIQDLTADQLKETGFASQYQVWKHFQKENPNITFEDTVTIISHGVQV